MRFPVSPGPWCPLVSGAMCLFICETSLAQEGELADNRGQITIEISCDVRTPEEVDRTLPGSLMELAICLENPDPKIRDDVGYAVMADILRNHRPEDLFLDVLRGMLVAMVQDADDDANGFRGPFAMLALSEVVRTDRIEPWMTPQQRIDIARLAADYLIALEDYRGFDETEGWRHGVAHTADVFLQLALNPGIGLDEAGLMLDAIATKVAPPDAPAYVFGEPERLARPLLFLARTNMLTDEIWADFFDRLKPGDEPRWQNPYMHEAGLRALHNTRAFAQAIYTNASASETQADDILAEMALELLRALP